MRNDITDLMMEHTNNSIHQMESTWNIMNNKEWQSIRIHSE